MHDGSKPDIEYASHNGDSGTNLSQFWRIAPRFPDQVEPDSMRMAQKMARRRMPRGVPNPPQRAGEPRRVLVSYSTKWPIADKSADEVLIFADRIQYEAADLQEEEEKPDEPAAWEVDPVQQVQSMLTDMETTRADGDETYFLFLSSLSEAEHAEAMAEACQDGRAKAAVLARAVGRQLDELRSAVWSQAERDATRGVEEIHRRQYMPLIAESPFRTTSGQIIHESPRPAEFVVSVHLTYGLK